MRSRASTGRVCSRLQQLLPTMMLVMMTTAHLTEAAPHSSDHLRHRRDTPGDQNNLVCPKDNTKILTPFLYINTVNSAFCSTGVSSLANDVYNVDYRTQCKRWLGLGSIPSRVGASAVTYCSVYSNGTAVVRAAVCCQGTTKNVRCFTRPAASGERDNYGTNYQGTVETCSDKQVCMTQLQFFGASCVLDYRVVSKGCVPTSNCTAAAASSQCSDHKTTPTCTTCCTTPFCNYDIDDTLTKVPGSCAAGTVAAPSTCSPDPCNGGYCTKDSSGNAVCNCPLGWTGSLCDTRRAQCTGTNPCASGGTCYDYGNGNYRCLCPTGFTGDACEFSSKLTCSSDDPKFYTESSDSIYVTSGCTSFSETSSQNSGAFLPLCIHQMRKADGTEFRNGVDGQVDYIPEFEPEHCRHGDNSYAWCRVHTCCPSCLSMPCQNGGYCITKPNNNYVCRCPEGFNGPNCEHSKKICGISGEPHIRTCCGKKITNQNTCKMNLTSTTPGNGGPNDFKIFVKSEHRDGDDQVSFVRYLQVLVCGLDVKMERDPDCDSRTAVQIKITVNGARIRTFPYNASCVNIMYNGNRFRLETDSGLEAEFDGHWYAFVNIPPWARGHVGGLCGHCDDVDCDHEKRRCDTDEYVGDLDDGDRRVADSCVVDDDEYDPAQHNNSQCSSPPEPAERCDPEMKAAIERRCSIVTNSSDIFHDCATVDPLAALMSYEECVYDACRINESSICKRFEAHALHCKRKGVHVDWRLTTGCELECPDDMVPIDSDRGCQPTCEDRDSPKYCHLPDTEKCRCATGKILFDGHCVDHCGCIDEHGCAHEFNSTWEDANCNLYRCEECSQCNVYETCIVVVRSGCPPDQVCLNGHCISPTTTAAAPTTTIPPTTTTTPPRTTTAAPKTVPPSTITTTAMSTGRPTTAAPTTTAPTTTQQGPSNECQPTIINGGLCDWGPWSLCVGGQQTRSRTCGCPEPSCQCPPGTVTEAPCYGGPCVGPTVETRNCCVSFNATAKCGACDFTKNKAGYFVDPCDCRYFYQCAQVSTQWVAYHIPCPPCLCFNQNTLTCSDLSDPNVPLTDPRCASTPTNQSADDYCLQFFPDPHDAYHYLWKTGGVTYNMPCPPGTIFVASPQCRCLAAPSYNTSKQFFCLNFDDTFMLNGVYVYMYNIVVMNVGFRGYSAYFDPDQQSHIEIPALTNSQPATFGISLWKRRTDATFVGRRGLVYNGDCQQEPSMEVKSETLNTSGAGIRTANDNVIDAFTSVADDFNLWVHHVLTYDGQYASYYVNNHLIGKVPATGLLAIFQCPLVLGMRYCSGFPCDFFSGYMDDICYTNYFYSADDVTKLYNHNLALV